MKRLLIGLLLALLPYAANADVTFTAPLPWAATQGGTGQGSFTLNCVVAASSTSALTCTTSPTISGTNITSLNAGNISTGLVPLANGGVHANLSGTGGTSQVLQQTTSGGNISVGQLTTSNLSDVTGYTLFTPTDASGAGLSLTNHTSFYVQMGSFIIACYYITYPTNASSANAELNIPIATSHGGALGNGFIGYNPNVVSTSVVEVNGDVFFYTGGSQTTNATLSGTTLSFTVIYPT